MGRCSTAGCLLFFLVLPGLCSELIQDNCTNYQLESAVFSVPGDTVMLNSTLVSSSVFNFSVIPYNITWYDSATGQEMTTQTGRILVRGETLWFLNVTSDDGGEYLTIVRTPTWCYRQSTKLVVDQPVAGECGRPQKVEQQLTKGVTDTLSCPLEDYIITLASYNITSSIKWYKGCDPIMDRTGRYTYIGKTKMKIVAVETEDKAPYTCTLSFTLGGVRGTVSETIDTQITDEYSLVPQVHKPTNEIIKADLGSNFTKMCKVFVPGVGKPIVDVLWIVRNNLIFNIHPSDRVYTGKQRFVEDVHRKGMWLERPLMFSELRVEDFNINYTCRAYSARGTPEGYFTLLPTDPDIILPTGVVLGGVAILFIITVIIYYHFKVDIVLWFRRTFPVLYTNKDLDGKLYDAYVAYPPPCSIGYNKEVETFAIYILPEVLEKACGYKLFIVGRDCLPGQAIVDSVEENMQASRRLLLVYNSSTFTKKRHTSTTSTNNNNIMSKNSNISDNAESKTKDSGMIFDNNEEVCPDPRQQFEVVAGMHRALLEGSLKVVLVELEEISPAQLASFPESVQHLRKKQGAVCWWKNHTRRQKWQTHTSGREEEETAEQTEPISPPLSPSCRFWKEMRYHMPVRSKRAAYPEKTALNL